MTSTNSDKPSRSLKISQAVLALARVKRHEVVTRKVVPPALMPGVVPHGNTIKKYERQQMAHDDGEYVALDSQLVAPYYAYANQQRCGVGFPGYPYLAELAQRSEYRSPTETIANEMTRRWIDIESEGEGDHSEEIKQIQEAFKEFEVQEHFRRVAEHDGFYGRGQIYTQIDGQLDDDRRQLPFLIEGIKIGSLLGFTTIEPMWTTPYSYNAIDPTAPDFFKPRAWFVMGKKTHASRLMTFVSREVPDMLKPAYNFGGLSMSQLMEASVNQWFSTRDAVSSLIRNFSILALKTNMQGSLSGDNSDSLDHRSQLFTLNRDNMGLMLLDKDSEELEQIAVPLSGLSELQAQAQEHMAAPSHIPLVKLFGITPSGLNANSDGEIQVFYDYVKAQQEAVFRAHLTRVLRTVQMHLFGKINEAITFKFVSLEEPDDTALAQQRKSDAEAGVAYINAGVIDADEERKRLSTDPNSGYHNLSGAAPGPPEPQLDPNAEAQREHEAEQANLTNESKDE